VGRKSAREKITKKVRAILLFYFPYEIVKMDRGGGGGVEQGINMLKLYHIIFEYNSNVEE